MEEAAVAEPKSYRDYTGVATWQLAEIIEEFQGSMTIDEIASRVPMDIRDLRKLLNLKVKFNGLALADKILLSLNLNISSMSNEGLITIIPASGISAPIKMARDEFWVMDIEPTPSEFHERANELAKLRDTMLGMKS